MRIRVAALLPIMTLAALLAGSAIAGPTGAALDEPPVQMVVTPAR